MTQIAIRRALLSVSEKSGVVELASRLAKGGVELVSTGGTARALRDAAAYVEDEKLAAQELGQAEQRAVEALRRADELERQGRADRTTFEQAGAAGALLDVKRQALKSKEAKRSAREITAKDLRTQIEELRSQLARYAGALEEDLASGREKVAAKAREGLEYEERFEQATRVVVSHLKGKPECRELLNEFITNGGPLSAAAEANAPVRPMAEAS